MISQVVIVSGLFNLSIRIFKLTFQVCHMQLSTFANALDTMEARARNRAHQVEGELSLAGRLLRKHVLGEAVGVDIVGAADVFCSDTASIQRGASVIRTHTGSMAEGRTRCDHFAYIPFMTGRTQNPCVMNVDQILLVRRSGMGWHDDEARIAVGTLYERLPVHRGAGLQSSYNDDPLQGACVVPSALFLSARDKKRGYTWAVHLSQVHCSCSCIYGVTGDTFLTSHKMGFHGRKDLQFKDE